MCVRKQSVLASIHEEVELNDITPNKILAINRGLSGIHRQLMGYKLPICTECNSRPLFAAHLNRCLNPWFRNIVCNRIPNGLHSELCSVCLDPVEMTDISHATESFIQSQKEGADDDILDHFERTSMNNC